MLLDICQPCSQAFSGAFKNGFECPLILQKSYCKIKFFKPIVMWDFKQCNISQNQKGIKFKVA